MTLLPESYAVHAPSLSAQQRAERIFAVKAGRPPREHFQRFRGYSLHIDEHLPEGRPVGTVLLVHGAGANGRLLAPFAAPFVARDLRVLAPDLPGYGITTGDVAHTSYAEWIALIVELARDAQRQGPVLLFGLSAGGLTVLRAAQELEDVVGVIATTLIDLTDPECFDRAARARWLGRLARLLFRYAPGLSDRLALPLSWLVPLSALTSDRELAQILARDPLLGARRISLRFMRSLHTYATDRADCDLSCPLLLVHPGADLWTPLALSLALFTRVRSPKRLVELSSGSHAPLEPAAFAELTLAIDDFLTTCGISVRPR
jgi:alpha-beta hydrolase superfamily lysophospholipase